MVAYILNINEALLLSMEKEYHHVDASIIVGIMDKRFPHIQNNCKTYMTKIGAKYKGGISVVSLGEIFKTFYSRKYIKIRKESLNFIDDLLQREHIEIFGIDDADASIFPDLRECTDSRIGASDLISLAVCIREKANVFMTLDQNILGCDKIRSFCKKKGVTIKTVQNE